MKKKKRLEFVLNDQVEVVADYFGFFFLLDTVECFYRTVDILENLLLGISNRDTQQMACSSLSLSQSAFSSSSFQ